MLRLLRRGQRDPAVVGFLRPDRDQVLLLRQPADGVHEQVAVALRCRARRCREIGVAEHDDARLRLRRVVGRLGRPARAPVRPTGADTAAPIDDRARLVALASSSVDLPGRSSALDVGFGPARGARLDERSARCGRSTPPLTGVDRARQRVRGHDAEALGDRVRRVARRHRHRRVGAEQLAHAADVHDDVVADVDAPVVRERDQVR